MTQLLDSLSKTPPVRVHSVFFFPVPIILLPLCRRFPHARNLFVSFPVYSLQQERCEDALFHSPESNFAQHASPFSSFPHPFTCGSVFHCLLSCFATVTPTLSCGGTCPLLDHCCFWCMLLSLSCCYSFLSSVHHLCVLPKIGHHPKRCCVPTQFPSFPRTVRDVFLC
jgi:hypothetical protein